MENTHPSYDVSRKRKMPGKEEGAVMRDDGEEWVRIVRRAKPNKPSADLSSLTALKVLKPLDLSVSEKDISYISKLASLKPLDLSNLKLGDQLLDACRSQNYEHAENLSHRIRLYSDVSVKDGSGQTALHYATSDIKLKAVAMQISEHLIRFLCKEFGEDNHYEVNQIIEQLVSCNVDINYITSMVQSFHWNMDARGFPNKQATIIEREHIVGLIRAQIKQP